MASSSQKTSKGAPWKRHRVGSWGDFQTAIETYLDGNWLFRGVGSVRHTLIPSVGRQREGYGYSKALEKNFFEQFKREALPFLSLRPENPWEWLALAQHYGVPTRLLDWSESPSVSLFFAVWGNDDEDAGLYVIRRPDKLEELGNSPFDIGKVAFFYPGYVTPRLVSQRGLFTVHPRPSEPYNPSDMQQIVIGKECKADFRRKLDSSGTHHAAIFADLDGLSKRLVALQGYRVMNSPAPGAPKLESSFAMARATSNALRASTPETSKSPRKINSLDPQKGQWGGDPTSNGWTITAKVEKVEDDWFGITLRVGAAASAANTRKKQLKGHVTFYLHDTFPQPVRVVKARNGAAVLELSSYGAFTVGVLIDQDKTMLELDLAELKNSDAPQEFRER
jgi:hypothetical protein